MGSTTHRIGITAKLMMVAGCAAATAAVATMAVGIDRASSFADSATAEAEELQRQRFDSIAEGARKIIDTENATLQKKLEGDIRVGESLAEQMGGFNTFDESLVGWAAVNQFDQSVTEVALPEMRVGDQWLGKVSDPADEAPLVDEVLRQVGAISTVFQRMNAEGDMLRVATNVEKSDGTRAINTFIPRTNPDGSPNAVVNTLLDGETFLGTAFVVDRWYITAYAPVFDDGGDVIGSFFVGLPQNAVDVLRDSVLGLDVGENGSMTVFRGSGGQRGQFVFGVDGFSDGDSALGLVDADGEPYVEQILQQAVELGPDEAGLVEYRSDELGTIAAHVVYYAPWDWVIVANAAEIDSAGVAQSLADGRSDMRNGLLIATLVIILVTAAIGLVYARRLTAPIRAVADRAKRISAGDFGVEPLRIDRRDELGELANAFDDMVEIVGVAGGQATAIGDRRLSDPVLSRTLPGELGSAFGGMIASLRELVDELRLSSSQLRSAAQQMTTVSSSLDEDAERTSGQAEMVASLGDDVSTNVSRVATAIEQMNESINEISRNATQSSQVAGEAVSVAGQTSDTISKLSQSSEEIGAVIKVINSIAEQTNLLALNATIEAARAGEAGKGFAVVANEVKELANQTAQATEEIALRIRNIQEDASGAVEANSRIGETIDRISEISTSIAGAVEQQSATTTDIGRSISDAAASTGDIAESIGQVASAADSTRKSTSETQRSAEELAEMATSLNELVDQFT